MTAGTSATRRSPGKVSRGAPTIIDASRPLLLPRAGVHGRPPRRSRLLARRLDARGGAGRRGVGPEVGVLVVGERPLGQGFPQEPEIAPHLVRIEAGQSRGLA